ncbi:MAG: Hsp20/alpha crystallin family protein [Prolixibacteraceae bacterium]|nr:Hsp20/alpha crystallin family protein [Prolixibacteraceae bacterium]MBN2774982.1 Hsp20/alpha crystallin family protein [Prolixibacteraceae bacterium]
MTLMKRTNSYYPSFSNFFDNFFGNDLMDWSNMNFSNTNTTLPAVNVKETDEAYEIEVAAPGMEKKDFRINLDNDVLTISSERKNEKEEKTGKYSRKEFSYQSFQRSFTVPNNVVDGNEIKAKYNDGILTISLPKKEEAKPRPPKEIKIS